MDKCSEKGTIRTCLQLRLDRKSLFGKYTEFNLITPPAKTDVCFET